MPDTAPRVVPTSVARAVGRFNADGPDGYRAADVPNAPLRPTREAAQADWLAHQEATAPLPHPCCAFCARVGCTAPGHEYPCTDPDCRDPLTP